MNITLTNSTKSHQNLQTRMGILVCSLLITSISNFSHAQVTTVLGFDDLPNGTVLSNQYQSLGVVINGANVIDGPLNGLIPKSMRNLVYAESGLMTFNFSLADIKTVSAYITGPANVGLYAYDSTNNLIGQSILQESSPSNSLLSVTSSSAPITRVEIHDGGSSFFVDDFTFITAPPAEPICRVKAQDLYNSVNALGNIGFKCATSEVPRSKIRILKEIAEFERLRAANAGQKKLLYMLGIIRSDIRLNIKAADAAPLLLKVDALISLTKAGSCAL